METHGRTLSFPKDGPDPLRHARCPNCFTINSLAGLQKGDDSGPRCALCGTPLPLQTKLAEAA